MFEKLETVELRFVELEEALSQPGISGKELTRISKERGSIENLVNTYRLYKAKKQAFKEAKTLLDEGDAEMRELEKILK